MSLNLPMKKVTQSLFALLLAALPVTGFAAAADVLFSQKNSSNTAWANVIVAPTASSAMAFNSSKVPISTQALTLSSVTSPAGIDLTLGLGTGGTALTLTSSTRAATFAGNLTISGGTVTNAPASGGPLFKATRPANTASAAFASLPFGAASVSNVEWYAGLYGNSAQYRIWNFNGSADILALNITETGNIGIGTNTPNYKSTVDSATGNYFASALLSGAIGTVGNYVGQLYGYSGTTYQKAATIFESLDGNGRGKFHIALNGAFNSANVSIADARLTVDYLGTVSIPSSTAGSSGAGALVVTGGLSAGNNGNASYIGGALTVAGTGSINGGTLFADTKLVVRAVTDGNVHFRNAAAFSAYAGAGLDFFNNAGDTLTDATFRASAYNFSSNGIVRVLSATAGSAGAGALVVTGGLSAGNNGGASYFGGQITANRPFMSTGAITANMTSAGGFGFSGGGTNFYSFGANSATSGSFAFQSVSSDASVNFNALTLAAGTGAATFAGAVTAGGTIQVTANTTPSGGSGLEIQGGATPTLFAYNRTGSAYLPLIITGSTLSMKMNNVDAFTLTGASAAASTATFAGAVTAQSLTSPASTNLTLAAGGTNQSVILTPSGTGGVGIGTTNPGRSFITTSLDVLIPYSKTDVSSRFGMFIGGNDANPLGATFYNVGGATAASRSFNIQATEMGSLNSILVLNPQGSNVGIGTADMTGLTGAGGLKIASSTAGSAGAGALVVTGGLSAGGASYFAGAVTVGGGTVTVGTTTNGKLNLYESFSSPGAAGIDIQHVTGTSGNTFYATFQYAAGVLGSITQFSTTGVLYNTASDYRLKDITGPLTNSGAFIDSLKPKTGTWKADGSKFVGFLAHEFAEVCPSAVTGEKDAVDAEGKPVYQAMQASAPEVMANLVAEIQSLRKRLAALEAK
jgi:hypothetical protein